MGCTEGYTALEKPVSPSSGFKSALHDKKIYGQRIYDVMLWCICITIVTMEILCIFDIHMFVNNKTNIESTAMKRQQCFLCTVAPHITQQ